jgi:hypothetical protein
MTDSARTEEIRARVEKAHSLGPCTHGYEADDADLCDACNHEWEKVVSEIVVVDVPYLLTELTVLREEVERLRAEKQNLLDSIHYDQCSEEECETCKRILALSPSPAQQEQK